ncbi:MAG TPA: D-aminoacyl-tRNA deacylase [Actinomycetota bacterium]|nr:D-aminoacyl-tRNA deacylase [Actinomycetota bacterium]
MRALVQRADGAAVSIHGQVTGEFDGPGLVVLVGVTHTDTPELAARLANKVWGARLFERDRLPQVCTPPAGPAELSASDLGLPLLVISQFTLYANTRKGRRPTWDAAAPGPVAEPLVDAFVEALRSAGARVHTGRFGADMQVRLTNDGPITVLFEV